MKTDHPIAAAPQKRPRPRSLGLLAILILALACSSFVRLYQAIVQWSFLEDLEMLSPGYLVATGLFWGLFGTTTGLLLWLRWRPARLLAPAFLLAFSLYYWFDRLLIAASQDRLVGWPFLLGANLLLLAWTVWAVSRRKVKAYFDVPD